MRSAAKKQNPKLPMNTHLDELGKEVLDTRKILVVDDDPTIRAFICDALSRAGMAADTAVDGAFAWEILKDGNYDLLITDQQMPKVTGVELIMKLHSAEVKVSVILVSGTLPTHELTKHPELNIEALLTKPVNTEELLASVKRVLTASKVRASISPSSEVPAALNVAHPMLATDPGKAVHRILVVDDNSDMRDLSISLLTRSGYAAEGANDGAAAWAALQASKYDLVVTDNKMPRMTGVEMIEKMRSAKMTIPVIMATGTSPEYIFDRKPWLRPEAFLEMPFSNADLLVSVKQLLDKSDGISTQK